MATKVRFGSVSPSVAKLIVRNRLIYSLCGLAIGVLCLVGGILVFFSGIPGDTDWSIGSLLAHFELSMSTPGVVLIFVGMVIIGITRYSVGEGNYKQLDYL